MDHESYVDCVWSAKTTIVGRTEGVKDTCLPPPNKTFVRELCNDYGNYKNLLSLGGYPTDEAMGHGRNYDQCEMGPIVVRSLCECGRLGARHVYNHRLGL